jgi:type VI secretion system secreted protein VgrG
MGRLYEGQAEPPQALPGKKTGTAFGTLTTPGGGSANRVAFDDAAGNEGMNFNASYDFNERTENDKVTGITADETNTVGVNRDVIVGQVHELIVTGSQSWTIGATHDLSVKSNYSIDTGTESVTVGGARMFDIAGDQTTQAGQLTRMVGGAKTALAIEHESILVKGASTRTYGGSWTQVAARGVDVTVGGVNGVQVGALRFVKCKGFTVNARGLVETNASRSEKAKGNWSWNGKGGIKLDVGGACNIKGSDVVFEAKDKIEIKAGGVKITITTSKVTIKGDYKSSQSSVDSADESYD